MQMRLAFYSFGAALLMLILRQGDVAAKPRALDGEPPVLKGQSSTQGKFYEQTFSGDLVTAEQPELTIAERFQLVGDFPDGLPATTMLVSCRIHGTGLVDKFSCRASDGDRRKDLSLRVAKMVGALDSLPRFRESEYSGSRRFFRRYQFELSVPAIAPAEVDLASGDMVALDMLPAGLLADQNRRLNYPSRALRQEQSGRQTIECQVQQDQSVICRVVSFDPPENASTFERAAARYFRSVEMPETLPDGRDSRNVRFQVIVTWRLP